MLILVNGVLKKNFNSKNSRRLYFITFINGFVMIDFMNELSTFIESEFNSN